MVRLAHEYDRREKAFVLCEFYGVDCKSCGINWRVFQSFGGDWIHQGVKIDNICESEAEIEFAKRFKDAFRSREWYPQVFIWVAKQSGFFLDFGSVRYSPSGRVMYGKDIEIDGKHHGTEEGMNHDWRRDQILNEKGIEVIRFWPRVENGKIVYFEEYARH